MLIIFIRTILIYLLLLSAMRLMGKRQIGELEVTDLVITLLLSDIATMPIATPEIPLSHAVIPIITLLAMEVTLSMVLSRYPRLKNLGSARPNILIRRGIPDQKELGRLRISAEELISELRQKDITDLREVDYAILEPNGKISVIPKAENRQPTCKDLGLRPADDSGIIHILISQGVIDRRNLKQLGLDDNWLAAQLKQHACTADRVYLMTVDDRGEVFLLPKASKKPNRTEKKS